MKSKRILTAFFFLLTASLVLAQEARDVPDTLFSIKLGGVYDLGDPDNKDLGNIPVKAYSGIKRILGNGIHYYFFPKEEDRCLEYLEECGKPETKKSRSSYWLYMLPDIPSTITTISQLERTRLDWEVQSIGWSQKAQTKDEAYSWARDLCETFKEQIFVEPEIKDFVNSKWFECTFSSGDREYTVSNINVIRSVELSYTKEIIDAKDKEIENTFQKLRTEKRPLSSGPDP